MAQHTSEYLRDVILRVHSMATTNYVQSDTIMRNRIGKLLTEVVMDDDIMRGFLGYGGPEASRNIIGGSGSLKS